MKLTKNITKKELTNFVGSLGKPSKMPGFSYGIPAINCNIGSNLTKVKNSVCFDCYAQKSNYQYPIS